MIKLKSVEITNFKSYKSVNTIPINSHFTCIIGPNGSGKSNILDAIVFCFDPSSRYIRVDNVKSLINGGNFCSVKVSLESNTENTIIYHKFTRHLNINGRSTYFHNSKKLLYDEYLNILSDLGINNFIIYQSAINTNITNLIEDLSGSIKYKLEYDNLKNEYNNQITQLKFENEKRKHFLILLKENEKCEEEQKKLENLLNRKKEIELDLFNLKIYNLQNKFKQMQNVNKPKFDFEEFDRIRNENQIYEDKQNKKRMMEKFNNEIYMQIEDKKENIKNIEIELQKFNTNYEKINNFENLEKEYLKEIYSQGKDIEQTVDTFSGQGLNYEILKDKLERFINEKLNLERVYESRMVKYKILKEKEEMLSKQLNEINNSILLNKNIKYKSIKEYTLKNKLRDIEGVLGFVKDLISCTNDKYKIAIHSLLSKHENSVIVKDKESAIKCIEYCKNNKLGRVTCYIESAIKCRKKNSFKNQCISPILVIEYPDSIKNIVNYIFDCTLIVEDMDEAYKIMETITYNKICTLDGIIIKNKGRVINLVRTEIVQEVTDEILTRRLNLINNLSDLKNEIGKYSSVEVIFGKLEKLKNEIQKYTKLINEMETKKKKDDFIKIAENIIFGDVFIKNGYLGYSDYIHKTSKFYKEEVEMKKNILEKKKEKLMKDIEILKEKIQNILVENGEDIHKLYIQKCKEKKDYEFYKEMAYELEKEKDRIIDEIKDLYFIEKNKLMEKDEIINLIYDESIQNNNTISLSSLHNELKEINRKINNMSPIYKNTVKDIYKASAYEEIKQKTLEIKNKLNKIKQIRNEVFLKCFEEINDQVNKLYTGVFDGTCNLVVENKEESFLSNLKYYVMVPNKKYMEYDGLSGGEKMISRIILIYSIYKYKMKNIFNPISFILLDEVDSNLDNYNVNKLVDFIRSEDIQVLMVSLKVGVYKCSDEMVGVYKKEGMSNLLYYRFV